MKKAKSKSTKNGTNDRLSKLENSDKLTLNNHPKSRFSYKRYAEAISYLVSSEENEIKLMIAASANIK